MGGGEIVCAAQTAETPSVENQVQSRSRPTHPPTDRQTKRWRQACQIASIFSRTISPINIAPSVHVDHSSNCWGDRASCCCFTAATCIHSETMTRSCAKRDLSFRTQRCMMRPLQRECGPCRRNCSSESDPQENRSHGRHRLPSMSPHSASKYAHESLLASLHVRSFRIKAQGWTQSVICIGLRSYTHAHAHTHTRGRTRPHI